LKENLKRSSNAFVLRRYRILLASERDENAYRIARCSVYNLQTARNTIYEFN